MATSASAFTPGMGTDVCQRPIRQVNVLQATSKEVFEIRYIGIHCLERFCFIRSGLDEIVPQPRLDVAACERHAQRAERQFVFQSSIQRPADDAARIRVLRPGTVAGSRATVWAMPPASVRE